MKAVFLFPGQGAQAVGMCSVWIRSYPSVARRLQQGSDLLGIDLSRLIDMGPPRAITQTLIAQVSIYCLSFALYEILVARGLQPGLLAGHSLGQFTALAASGAVTFDDGLALVKARGAAMHEVNQSLDGTMLAIHANDVQRRLSALVGESGDCWISNRNAPGQWIVAGRRLVLQRLQSMLALDGVATRWLDVAGPYHTPLMGPAAARFEQRRQLCDLHDADIPVVANSTALVLRTREQWEAELARHMVSPVDWVGTMEVICSYAPDLLVEVGPGRTLKGLTLRNAPHLKCLASATPDNIDRACEAFN